MNDLDKALADITAIRSQMARGAVFRGYGPMTIAATGALAVLAGWVQPYWVPSPAVSVTSYVALWLATAVLSVMLIGVEMVARTRRIHTVLADEMIHAATEQFMPAAAAGVLLTAVMLRTAPESLWMLPGLWLIVFSLGIFASCRSLPRPMVVPAIWYLAAGLAVLSIANGPAAFSPFAMAVPFGVGQLLIAVILYRSMGERDAET